VRSTVLGLKIDSSSVVGFDRPVSGHRDVAVAVQHDPQRDLGFQSGQRRTQAEVDPMPEGEVRVRLAVDVEAVRVGEQCVAVRRRQPDQDDPVGRHRFRNGDEAANLRKPLPFQGTGFRLV
jgi:hypothetical protein